MRFGVVVFPGSNCDLDALYVLRNVLGVPADLVWHGQADLSGYDTVILPGGFSYGDYLRAGALAAFSPVMGAVKSYAERGGLVVGICNGFQILVEAGLLPGALITNKTLSFICREVPLRVERTDTPFTKLYRLGEIIRLPIAHQTGNYMGNPDTLAQIQNHRQILFRYCGEEGESSPDANPNGSALDIAGLQNLQGNVLGMMPHPERASESVLGRADGLRLFESILAHAQHRN
ncbi:MAG: phosphoribosylformylglycinamidine synthase subunit PurQ [Nitrospirae bacterium]|nr:phosphoribosylformylglycinamidine synthase subunit PurQ [Nitrospirota bacterium]